MQDVDFVVQGGAPLGGTVETSRSKNGAVALLAASLLNRGETTLQNVPKIEEVHRLVEVLRSIGAEVTWSGRDLRIKPPETFDLDSIDRDAATKTRSILMFIGPLLHAFTHFELPQSGGCTLGTRSVRPHLMALEKFGVSIEALTDRYEVTHDGLAPAEVVLYESSDTATINALYAAAGIAGESIIKYASANYQVQEVCGFLTKLGVEVEGVGTTTLVVRGKLLSAQKISYSIAEDPIDSMFFIATAAVNHAAVTVRRAPIEFLEIELLILEKMGLTFSLNPRGTSENGITKLADLTIEPSELIAFPEKIHPRPYPGLNMDNVPFFAVIATQAEGTTLINDWVYEKRAVYYSELERLGAKVALQDPHRVSITGPSHLRAADIVCPPVLRIGAMLVIAMLAAEGRSTLHNVYTINRGYEDLVARLQSLGASIEAQVS